MQERRPEEKEIITFKTEYYKDKSVLKRAPKGAWKYIMSRHEKIFRNKWNTESKPYTPTPKGKIGGEEKK